MRLITTLALILGFSGFAFGQNTQIAPDCVLGGAQTVLIAVGTSALFDNRSDGCTSWTLNYTSYGFSAATIDVVSAPNQRNSPGAAVVWAGASGTTFPVSIGSSGTISINGYQPYVGVSLVSKTDTGTFAGAFQGTLYGWRSDRTATLGVTAPIIASSSAVIAVSSTNTTQLIAAVTGKSIYATGYGFTIGTTSATAQTVQFVYGTGANCATGQVVIWGALSGATEVTLVGENTPTQLNYGGGVGTIFQTPASQALCIKLTGTQGVGGGLSFAQMFYMRPDREPLTSRPWEYSKAGILQKRTWIIE